MKSEYERFCELAEKEFLSIEELNSIHLPPYISNEFVISALIERKAIQQQGNLFKVFSKDEFKKLALFYYKYDFIGEIGVSLKDLIERVLIYNDEFVNKVESLIDKKFTTKLTNSEREKYIKTITHNGTRGYLIQIVAVNFLSKFLKDNCEHFIDEALIDKVKSGYYDKWYSLFSLNVG